jgi:peptide subunit release factor 1 (eRF1)
MNEYYVKRSNMSDFLDRLKENAGSVTSSVYLPPDLSFNDIQQITPSPLPDTIIELAAGSITGTVIFAGKVNNTMVLPPFPLKEKVIFSDCTTGPLRELLAKDFIFGLVLVHLGTYAVGVCRGDVLVSSKVGTGLVHGRTRKGGSSSRRFQRRRENQAREFLERVCGHAQENLQPYEKTLDYLVYGGPHQTVLQLQKECPLLKMFEDRTLQTIDVPALRQKVLEAAVTRVWSSRIIEWGNE